MKTGNGDDSSLQKLLEHPDVRRARLPKEQAVELATLVDAAPAGDDWLHEIKFDGYRMLCRVANGKARFISRNGHDWTAKFPELAEAAGGLAVERGDARRRGGCAQTRRHHQLSGLAERLSSGPNQRARLLRIRYSSPGWA